jgi:hypothetical protein
MKKNGSGLAVLAVMATLFFTAGTVHALERTTTMRVQATLYDPPPPVPICSISAPSLASENVRVDCDGAVPYTIVQPPPRADSEDSQIAIIRISF